MRFWNINVTPGFLLLMAWLYYCGQGRLALLTVLSSAVHEVAHYVFLRLFGARVQQLTIGATGANMAVTGSLSYPGEILVAAVGPLSNLLLAVMSVWLVGERGYLFAGINLALAAFNLLPVSGLDGGQCLRAGVTWLLGVRAGEVLCWWVDGVVVVLAVVAGGVSFFFCGNITGFLVGVWLWGTCMGKKPRRDGKKGLSFRLRTGKMIRA